jgi:hypothetical protein
VAEGAKSRVSGFNGRPVTAEARRNSCSSAGVATQFCLWCATFLVKFASASRSSFSVLIQSQIVLANPRRQGALGLPGWRHG